MTEAFLRELGLDGEVIQAILEHMRSRDAEQAAVYDGMLKTEREGRIRDLMERAGVRGGRVGSAVKEELFSILEDGGDIGAHLALMREQEPGFFAPSAPYFAASMQEEGGISSEKAPFHWLRSREGGGR